MNKFFFSVLFLGGVLFLAACGQSHNTPAPLPSAQQEHKATATAAAPQSADREWKAECLHATIRALEMERATYAKWLETGQGDKEMYRRALAYLDAELKKYRSLSPSEFQIKSAWKYIPDVSISGAYGQHPTPTPPGPITLDDAWVTSPLPGLIYFKGQSRSGPFYTAVGIRGGNFAAIKPNQHYRMVLQPILPASYPFPAYYVCIKSFVPLKK